MISRASSRRPTLMSHRGDSGIKRDPIKSRTRGMAWEAKQNRHRKAPPPSSVKDVPKPTHADKLIPEKFARKVRAIFLPRCAAGDSSAVHAGAMTMMKATPQPAQSRATSMWARFTAEAWRTTPSVHQKMASQRPLIPVHICQLSAAVDLRMRPGGRGEEGSDDVRPCLSEK